MNWKWKVSIFGFLMAAHWAEHIVQTYQVYVMGMHRKCSLGLLGWFFPWLVATEYLHFIYATLTVIGMLWLWNIYGQNKWWRIGLFFAVFHCLEHTLLFAQATTGHNLFGSPVPTTLIQQIVPRIELHLFYNTLASIPMVIAMWQTHRRSRFEHHQHDYRSLTITEATVGHFYNPKTGDIEYRNGDGA